MNFPFTCPQCRAVIKDKEDAEFMAIGCQVFGDGCFVEFQLEKEEPDVPEA